jgi:hypothetical protein
MNDQDHSLSLSDPDRSLVLSHLLVNFLKNLVSCQTRKLVTKEVFSHESLLDRGGEPKVVGRSSNNNKQVLNNL